MRCVHCGAERKAYGKPFGNIVYGDGKKEFCGLI